MTLKFAEHKDRFSINFLLAASTVMSKIDVDKFEHYRTTSSRHLSMMMTKAFRGGEGGADTVKHILWMAVIMALANFHLVYEKEGHLQQVPVTVSFLGSQSFIFFYNPERFEDGMTRKVKVEKILEIPPLLFLFPIHKCHMTMPGEKWYPPGAKYAIGLAGRRGYPFCN